MFGLVFFLLCTTAGYLFFPIVSLTDNDRQAAASGRTQDQKLAELHELIDRGFEAVDEVVRAEFEGVEQALANLDVDPLRRLLVEVEPTASSSLWSPRVQQALDGLFRDQPLEFLCLVSLDGALLADNSSSHDATSRLAVEEELVDVCAPFLQDATPRAGIENLPEGLVPRLTAGRRYKPSLFLVGVRPVWTRPDAAPSLLVGGKTFDTVITACAAIFDNQPKLRWHVFGNIDGQLPVVFAGSDRHSVIRRSLAEDLERNGVSEELAFQRAEPQLGRWRAFRNTAGTVAGGVGVTVGLDAMRAALLDPRPTSVLPSGVEPWWSLLDLVLIVVGVFLGLVLLVAFVLMWTRQAREAERMATDERHQERLAEEMRKLVASMARSGDSRSTVVDELASTGEDFKRRFAELSSALERVTARLETNDERAVRERVQSEIARIQCEWALRVQGLGTDVDDTRALGEKLVADLEDLRQAEAKLRDELKESREREEELERQFDDVHKLHGEASQKEGELSVRVQDLESEERTTREQLNQAAKECQSVIQDLQEARVREVTLADETARVKEEFESTTMTLQSTREAKNKLEVDMNELKAEQENLLTELEASNEKLKQLEQGLSRTEQSAEEKQHGQGDIADAEYERLRKENEFLDMFQESLMRSIPMALVITDTDNRVISWNPHANNLLNVSESDALGQNLFELETSVERSAFRERFAAAESHEKATQFTVPADGPEDKLAVQVTLSPLIGAEGDAHGHLLLLERTLESKAVV